MGSADALDADWLGFCRRSADAVRAALAHLGEGEARARGYGRGEGGDTTLAVDRVAEDAIFRELEALGVGVCALSEERGTVEVAGGGEVRVVIDPVDGSLNAKRSLPPYSVSIAVADGDDMRAVAFAYVADLTSGEEWWAARGKGAHHQGERIELPCGGARLEVLGVESAHPRTVAEAAETLAAVDADRLRMIGTVALALCYVASGRFDAMLSLRPIRSVDVAAGQLILRESGGTVAFPDTPDGGLAASLDLDMRSRVLAGAGEAVLGEVMQATDAIRR